MSVNTKLLSDIKGAFPVLDYPESVMNALKEVDLEKAIFRDDGIENFYKTSGLKVFEKFLINRFNENQDKIGRLNTLFLEFTTLASTQVRSEKSNLFTFIGVWEKPYSKMGQLVINRGRINQFLEPLYITLGQEQYGLFYHPEFFALPEYPNAQITRKEELLTLKATHKLQSCISRKKEQVVSALNDRPDSYLGLTQVHAPINRYGQIYAKNASLPFRYAEFWENLIIPDSEKNPKRALEGHILLHELFDLLFTENKNSTYLLSIPVLGKGYGGEFYKKIHKYNRNLPKNSHYAGQAAMFIYLAFDDSEEDINNKYLPNREKFLQSIAEKLTYLVKDMTYNFPMEIGAKQQEDIYKSTRTAAKAAIASRNGSHNVGSHILSSVLSKFQELPDTHILFKHVQERFDFIALIITGFPQWTYASWFVSDLMHRFYKQRLFLNYIADAEGLQAFEYQKRVFKPDGAKIEENNSNIKNRLLIKLQCKKGDTIIPLVNAQNDTNDINEDVLIAIPGGIVGYHAFYTILENIIRNSAKYGWGAATEQDERPPNLEITIEFEEIPGASYVEFRIWDNISLIPPHLDPHIIWKDDEYTAQIPSEEIPLHRRINYHFASAFTNPDTGRIERANLGISELKIAAGYLNRLEAEKIGQKKKEKNLYERTTPTNKGLISAYAQLQGDKYYLGFKFAIPKPQQIFIEGEPYWYRNGSPHHKIDMKKLLESYSNGTNINYSGVYLNKKDQTRQQQEKSYQDSDFVLILDYKSVSVFGRLTSEIISAISREHKSERKELMNEFMDKLDTYPGRIIIVSKYLHQVFKKNELPNIISKRLCIISPTNFYDELVRTKDSYSCLYLFWNKHLKTLTGNSEKRVHLSIGLSGDNRQIFHRELYQLAFNNFKHLIVDACYRLNYPKKDLRIIKKALSNVSFKDILTYLKIEGYSWKKTEFIKYWLACANVTQEKYDLLYDECYRELKYTLNHFLIAAQAFLQKDENEIETLPAIYHTFNQTADSDSLTIEIESLNKELNKEIPPHKKPYFISYDRHKLVQKDHQDKSIIYSEALSGAQIYYSILKNITLHQQEAKKLLAQLYENGLLRILVIDERVSQYYETRSPVKINAGNITLPEWFYIDNIQFNLQSRKISITNDAKNKIEIKRTGGTNREDIDQFDVLIIHQGILDKIFQRGNKDNKARKKDIEDFIRRCKRAVPYVVMTSGRGEPDTLPDHTKFIPYSNVQAFLLSDYPEKFLLTQVLMKVSSTSNN